MPNPRLIELAERQKNKNLPEEKTEKVRRETKNPAAFQKSIFSDSPEESFIFSYDGPHKDFFQELISKHNETYSGTKAEIPTDNKGEVQNMYIIKRISLISTIYNNHNLRNHGLFPITPIQGEYLLKEGKLPNPKKYWEDLALLLFDTNRYNPKEAQAIYESLKKHRKDLGLSQSDLESRLIIVNAGGEVDADMPHGVKPIIIPGITQVYQHEVLEKTGEEPNFEGYGLNGGLPLLNQLEKGNRTLYMPDETEDIGLRVLYRNRYLDLGAWGGDLAYSNDLGRVNFAPQGRTP
jgi:hypothetical protein